MDGETNTSDLFIDVHMRVCISAATENLHIMAIQLSDFYTVSYMSDVVSHPLNPLIGHQENKKLILLATDCVADMARGSQGATMRFEMVFQPGFYCPWRAAH